MDDDEKMINDLMELERKLRARAAECGTGSAGVALTAVATSLFLARAALAGIVGSNALPMLRI